MGMDGCGGMEWVMEGVGGEDGDKRVRLISRGV